MTPLHMGAVRARMGPTVKVIVDGNSIYAGHSGTAMHTLLAAQSPVASSGAVVVGVAVSGHTWRMLNGLDGGSSADVDAALDATKTNILVVGETTNSVGIGGRSGAEAFSDAAAYIAARRAAAAAAGARLRVVLCSSLPRNGTAAGAVNTRITDCDNLMRQGYRGIDADVFVDYRVAGSPFAHSGDAPEPFQAMQDLWAETTAWLHPNTAGNMQLARMIAAGIRRVRA